MLLCFGDKTVEVWFAQNDVSFVNSDEIVDLRWKTTRKGSSMPQNAGIRENHDFGDVFTVQRKA